MKQIFKLLFVVMTIIMISAPIVVYCLVLDGEDLAETSGDFGVFGDYVGGTVGTIVGIISIYLLYITYTSQVKFARKQEESAKRLQFESTFFNMLEQQQMLREQLGGKVGDNNCQSLSYLKSIREELSDALSNLNYRMDEVTEGNKILLKNLVNQLYLDFFLPKISHLGHYFRHLYHILKYVEDSNIPNAKGYVDILQAQLSNDELYLLAINGISNYGRRKMLPLMDKYSLLENFNANDDMLLVKLLSIFYVNTKSKYLMAKSKKIIFIGGIHGVGKSTFVDAVRVKYPSVEGLSCSTILKWENPAYKKVEDVGASQNRLLANLPYFVDMDKEYLLDGHFCLLTERNVIERIPLDVFEAINPDMILLLEESPMVISQRLLRRDSTQYSVDLLQKFLIEERTYAKEVAETIGVPIIYCNKENWNLGVEKVSKFLAQS